MSDSMRRASERDAVEPGNPRARPTAVSLDWAAACDVALANAIPGFLTTSLNNCSEIRFKGCATLFPISQ